MPHNPQNTISQTALKHYNKFRNVRIEAIRWVQMTIDTGIKFKVETSAKERDQQLLDFITIDILKLEPQHTSSQEIITLPMNKTINIYLNKYPVLWKIINFRLLQPSDSFMKSMCRHQNLDGLQKHFPKKIHKSTCTICYTAKNIIINKGTTFDTNKLQPG